MRFAPDDPRMRCERTARALRGPSSSGVLVNTDRIFQRARATVSGDSHAAIVRVERPAAGAPSLVLAGPRGNALSPGLLAAMAAAVEELASCEEQVVLLESEHARAFMVGGDLDLFAGWLAGGHLAREWSVMAAECARVFERLQELPAVKIAVVEGAAVGGGLELAVMCDYRLAARGATLGFPEVRLGVYPSAGSVARLARDIGEGHVLKLVLGGRMLDADQAAEIGVIHEVVESGKAKARAREVAQEIGECGLDVLQAVRREIRERPPAGRVQQIMRELLERLPPQELARRVEAQRAMRHRRGIS